MAHYIAAVFDTQDAARKFKAALSTLAGVPFGELLGRNTVGDIVALDGTLPGDGTGAQQEAIDQLSEKLPDGWYAFLAYVEEADTKVINRLAQEYDGVLFRRSAERLQNEGFVRFQEAGSV